MPTFPRFRARSLRSKMILFLVPLMAAVLVVMTVLSVSRMTTEQRKASLNEVQQLAAHDAAALDAPMQARVKLTQTVATTIEQYRNRPRAEALEWLHQIALANADSAGIYVGYGRNGFDGRDAQYATDKAYANHGQFVPYWNRLGGALSYEGIGDIETQSVWTQARDMGRAAVGEPNAYEGQLMASYIAPIMRGGQQVGIAGDDVLLKDLDAQVRRVKALKTGYAFLVSNRGVFVSAPDRTLLGKSTLRQLAEQRDNPDLARVAAGIRAGRAGRVETTDPFTGKHVALLWSPMKAGGWGLVLSAPIDEVLAPAHRLRNQLIVAALIGILLMIVAVVLVAGRLTAPLGTLVDRLRALNDVSVANLKEGIRALARGDLTVAASTDVEPVPVHGHDEVATASRTLNALIEQTGESVDAYNESRQQLGDLIGRVSSTAGTVSAASTQMAHTSEEAGRAVGEVAHAVGEVASGAQRQVESVERARTASLETVHATETSAASARDAAQAAEEARRLAHDGAASVAQATAAMAAVREASGQAATAIRALGLKSEQIGGIVDTIGGIAEQTNLLALNAAIEAARAGDQGRGFAVVADEVRKLAEESRDAAASIATLIAEIQAETARAVTVVERGAEETNQGAGTVEAARASFEAIGGSVEDVTGRTAEIAAAVEQIAGLARRISDDLTEVASVAEQSSASSEEVAASTQETSASTQEIAASAQALSRTAGELEELITAFRVA